MCARSVELFVDVHVVKRHAIVDVLCGPVVNVVIGVHVFVLSVPLVVVRVVPMFLAVILYQFIPLFHRSHFSHMFSQYSHGILGVVFTHPVGYIRPQSAVNDPTVTKQVNSKNHALKRCPNYLFLSGFPDQSVLGTSPCDFRRNKEPTLFLASSTKKKNSFVSIVAFVELLLLFFILQLPQG